MTQLKPGTLCPLIGEDCRGLECSWFTQVRGTNPQTGEEMDEWGCAVTWLPMLLIETSNQARQTGAAVESFRNETVNTRNMLATMSQMPKLTKVIDHDN